jgi:hypothetical protein
MSVYPDAIQPGLAAMGLRPIRWKRIGKNGKVRLDGEQGVFHWQMERRGVDMSVDAGGHGPAPHLLNPWAIRDITI